MDQINRAERDEQLREPGPGNFQDNLSPGADGLDQPVEDGQALSETAQENDLTGMSACC